MDDLRVERRGGGYGRSNYAGPIYTGLAIWRQWFGASLYADNNVQNRIDVFNGSFAPLSLGPNAFTNPFPNLVPV